MTRSKLQRTNEAGMVPGVMPLQRQQMAAPFVVAPRFDHDFSRIKVHAESGPVLRRQPAAPASPATALGTAKTTSPIAKISPRKEMLTQLTDETTLFNNAQVIIDWLSKKAPAPAAGDATTAAAPAPFTFTAEDLMKEKTLVKKMKPVPKSEADLTVTLDFLITYGVIERNAATTAGTPVTYTLKTDAKTNKPDITTFTKDKKDIKQFKDKFKERSERPDPLDPVVTTSVLPLNASAGAKTETDREKKAEGKLAELKQKLADLDKTGATDEETIKKRAALQEAIGKAEKSLARAQGFHTFAADVTNLLLRLQKINTSWRAGTYPGHSWGEFSADIFLRTTLVNVTDAGDFSGKFWDRKVARKFFDDLNTVCEEEDPVTGKFAWRAIYNDIPLAKEVNKKFGAGRVLQKENHGPDGKKLHIHLDLRPIKQRLDAKSGFEISKGRVKLLP